MNSIILLPLIAADMYFTSMPLVCQVLEIWQQCNGGMEQKKGERDLQSVCLSFGCNTQLTELEGSHLPFHGRLVLPQRGPHTVGKG